MGSQNDCALRVPVCLCAGTFGSPQGRGRRSWSPGAPTQKEKSLLRWEGRTGSGSQGNYALKGKACLKGGRVGMLDGFNGRLVCLFFPEEESDSSTRTDTMSCPKG